VANAYAAASRARPRVLGIGPLVDSPASRSRTSDHGKGKGGEGVSADPRGSPCDRLDPSGPADVCLARFSYPGVTAALSSANFKSSLHWPTSRLEAVPAQHVERDALHRGDAVGGVLEVVIAPRPGSH
jgi:hypothetical protein